MKKIVQMCLTGGIVMLLASCGAYTIHGATNNPVGKKTGTVSIGLFSKDKDFSYSAAAKKGKINK